MKFISKIQNRFAALFLLVACCSPALALPPLIDIAQGPLFSAGAKVKPNMVLALSVEFPTTGAAYNIDVFDTSRSYIGYWDPNGCYDYDATNGYFKLVAASDAQWRCNGKWSGNMLNWATSSAIDMLRYAMTGGDRIIDTATQTVLQRAYVRDGFYNSSNMRNKQIQGNLSLYTGLVGTPGGPATGDTVFIANCRNLVYFGSQNAGGCGNPGNNGNYGTYFARAEVCKDAGEIVRRSDLCIKYPSGNYKPTGTMQQYAEQMRFATFGYLADDTTGRYGGVLRAPMRYVGPTKFDASFNPSTNTESEWDATTGVFATNPITSIAAMAGSPAGNSGVINYLNKFGRTGTPGYYKTYDPVGELYYESLRYIQGLPPTADATSGITAGMFDGYPVYTTWTPEPIQASCQNSNIVIIGDQNTWYDKSIPGNTRTDGDFARSANAANFEPDVMYWTKIVSGFESNLGYSYTDSKGIAQTTIGNLNPVGNRNLDTATTGAGGASFYMAGLAYWAHTQQIHPVYTNARVTTYAIDVDEYGNGKIGDAQINNQYFLAGKYGGFIDSNSDGNPFITTDGVNNNNEWADGITDVKFSNGTYKPKAANYFIGSKSEQLIPAIRKIFADAAKGQGTTAGGSISSRKITNSTTSIFVPQFDSGRWSGTVLSYGITLLNNSVLISPSPTWSAAAVLDGVAPLPPRDPTTRLIYTLSDSASGIPFLWNSLDSTYKGWLDVQPYSAPATSDGYGIDRVAFLRGDRSKEASTGGMFRTRNSAMGDPLNSGPVYVGAPNKAIQGSGFDSFYSSYKNRTQAVYVGANDGMLHAFNAVTGSELFAYVPRMVAPNLNLYTSKDYAHRPFVDATPVIAEAQIGATTWKTVLVSGVGGGAQGVFALDVTDPAAFDASKVLWEFTDKDDKDMGFVTTAPKILKFKVSGGTTPVYRWFAVVPSGLNNYQVDGNQNGVGDSALFLLALDKAQGASWVRNVNYYKIVVPVQLSTVANALATPGEFVGIANEVLYLYAGDTQGNMWRFDFLKPAPWSESNALGLNSKPLFVAKDPSGKVQPITIEPEVGLGPQGSAIVMFGTGKFFEASDTDATKYQVQSIYGISDDDTIITANRTTALQARTAVVSASGLTISGPAFAYGSGTGQKRGWYFDLTGSLTEGERQVTNIVLTEGFLFFNTLTPNPSVCGPGGGGRTCAVNAATGTSVGETCQPSTVGILSAPLVIEEGDGNYTTTDSVGRRTATQRLSVVSIGTGAADGKVGLSKSKPIKDDIVNFFARMSWREVADYKELKAGKTPGN
jgi:type IV pilus assembly protein PilY1